MSRNVIGGLSAVVMASYIGCAKQNPPQFVPPIVVPAEMKTSTLALSVQELAIECAKDELIKNYPYNISYGWSSDRKELWIFLNPEWTEDQPPVEVHFTINSKTDLDNWLMRTGNKIK